MTQLQAVTPSETPETPDIPETSETPEGKPLASWTAAIIQIATHYRLACSPGMLYAAAEWQHSLPLERALINLSRQAGLSARMLDDPAREMSSWRLPLAVELSDGQVAVISQFDGEDTLTLNFANDPQLTPVSFKEVMPKIRHVVAFRPVAVAKDSRIDRYLEQYKPDWLRKLVLRDIKSYGYVMLASLLVNVLALSGILFSMQVYDRAIPAQSYPTLYVLFGGVLIAVFFSFLLRISRSHITDVLGKRADMRVSDRVFGHALRLRESAVPRSTGSFISQLRELEQIRELVTSTTVTAIIDMPFFFLFLFVLTIISPHLAWIAPAAAVIMIVPGLLLQKRLATLARKSLQESTLRNAVLVESVQGLEDIKLMQAEDRFLQQWNSYIQITAQSGVETRRLTQGLVNWGVTVQTLVYATVVVIGAPMVIDGDITTGAIVAASLLSSRMISPMTKLCGVLARWQQVKAAKAGLDSIMNLPVENSREETRVHCSVLHGHYQFTDACFRYRAEDTIFPLKIGRLTVQPGERIALLGRNGAGKSTLLKAMAGGMELASGEVRLDNLSLPHIDTADLRRNIGLLTQNARLFHGTLRENLMLGAPNIDDEALFEVLEVSGAANYVRRLPLGLDHMVMEGGLGLSGGQRQSVLLARMLLRDPNIVLLDEPTASLDEHTERDFIQRLGQWLAGRTLIVATHRAAVLELVDRVVVLKEGLLVMDAPKDKAISNSRNSTSQQESSDEKPAR